ncbi:MAG: sugar ABC transporter ATP-binding protein [Lachnospiraceae bacterium]|nr:sugar ABC transporter ATP-binding protein [Lachnospiraceae bacterium]MDD7077818.1 sugar ABC transporter ATP-binding protein [Lachnospiraceae bacterium]MDY3730521.1 sugar ABC transporter ATP-binding protein [Candidatus Choladocola sp.]
MSEQYLLEMKHICKSFPGVKALQDVSLQLKAGEIHALLGENGAGKSTLIKVLGGIYIAEEGEIYIEGKKVEIGGVKDAQANGIAIIHQELVLVPYMTVAENIFLGREHGKGRFVNKESMNKEAQTLLDQYQMNINAETLIKDLTIAQQQMVEIVKAISFNSKILVMDEPTSSISDKEVGFLFETMRTLTKKGVGIIYISHKMSELEEICDRVTVMRDGTYVGTKEVKDTSKDELVAMMVGRELTNYYTRDFGSSDEVVLKCENIADGKMARGASFEVHKGEIIGFAGLVGAGRSEVMKCIFGLTKNSTGDIYMEGKKIEIHSPIDAVKYGIALVPENRKQEGLYKVQSVKFNSTIQVLKDFIKGIRVDLDKEEKITQDYIDMMSTKTPSQEQMIGNLSGGNQQKVMIGRWLATNPKVLILDEPTRGVDVGAKSEIYAIMNELAKQGMAIIMISSELPEILNMSDRIYVMREGKIRGCFHHSEGVTQEDIMQLAAV